MKSRIDKYLPLVDEINKVYGSLSGLSNDELRQVMTDVQAQISTACDKKNALDEALVRVYAIVKETAHRFTLGDIVVTANDNDMQLAKDNVGFVSILNGKAIYRNRWIVCGQFQTWNMIHYDEQLLGGIMLHYQYAIEMATGEGKTLVATLPVFLNALTHEGVHLMTVNDYLSRRDYEQTRPIYMLYGLSVGCIEEYNRGEQEHKEAYRKDITFGTNSTFTFDYLWDHIAMHPEECVQTNHNFAIIDELDSILIDDADEPHMVGGGHFYNVGDFYKKMIPYVKELMESKGKPLYTSDIIFKSASFTNEGIWWLRTRLGDNKLFSVNREYELGYLGLLSDEERIAIAKRFETQNALIQLLHALTVYFKDEDYIIINDNGENKVVIIDPHTGRAKPSSRWEHGLHTAMEVKEGVKVEDDYDGLGVISLKNYFKLYEKVAGMSGTIMPVEKELKDMYKLKCALLPTHKKVIRDDKPLRVFKTTSDKDNAIIKAIKESYDSGKPTLVGCITIKRGDEIARLLTENGISFNKLDAKSTKDENDIIAKAGIGNTVTVATSVAGRGTDIKPSEDALQNGGLYVIGTDMFESVRVDRQLKGRSGRQGNPGTTQFFASMEDTILKYLSEEDAKSLSVAAQKVDSPELSDSETVMYYFRKAQANREEYFRNHRKETALKDDTIAPHRRKFYDQRNAVLFGAEASEEIIRDLEARYGVDDSTVREHLCEMFNTANILMKRSTWNNKQRDYIDLPFSDSLHEFAVSVKLQSAKDNFDYFRREFERQVILMLYDKHWKKFVMYLMEALDDKEINMLTDRYDSMMQEINGIILSRLQHSKFLVSNVRDEAENIHKEPRDNAPKPKISLLPDSSCPCGSGRKYRECHGRSAQGNPRIKRRR